MADELEASVSVSYEDALGIAGSVEVSNLTLTLTDPRLLHSKQNVGTSEEAIELGDVTAASMGVLVLVNRGTTYSIDIKTATSGTIIARLYPAGSAAGLNWCCFNVGSGITAPFAVANTGASEMEIFLTEL